MLASCWGVHVSVINYSYISVKEGRKGVGKERREVLSLSPPHPRSFHLSTPLIEISFSLQPSSALRNQDGGHTFREEGSPKIHLHCWLHGLPSDYNQIRR